MSDYTQSIGNVALAHQAVTHPATVKGSEIDVRSMISIKLSLFHASVEATANTNPGRFQIFASAKETGDDSWVLMFDPQTLNGTPDTEAIIGAGAAAGASVVPVALTAGFLALDKVYIQNATLANSEWNYCKRIVSNTSIDLLFNLTNAQAAGGIVWNDCTVLDVVVDNLAPYARLLVAFSHEGTTGADCHVKALYSTATAFA